MSYRVVLSEEVIQTLKKMDRPMAARIYSWIGKNPEGCSNPRRVGKSLVGNHSGEWTVIQTGIMLTDFLQRSKMR